MYYPTETQVTPLINVRRERVLPTPGEILVSTGDRVEPTQTVARANLRGDLHILSAARLLDIAPSQMKQYLQVKQGDQVERGQVIAKRRRRTVKSPVDGTVAASGGGLVLIEPQPTLFELHAYISGTVTNVVEPHGLVIETTGAVIQGVWGGGGESLGVLKCAVKNPDEMLHAQAIDPSCHGVILVGGAGLDDGVITQAQEFMVRGIVVGGLLPALIPQIEQAPFPVVVTEGIGTIPMSAPIFRLLKTNDGREASLSGKAQSRWGIVRPEVIIPMPAETVPSPLAQPGTPLAVGARVRVVRAPYMSAVGTVAALPARPRRIETGAKVYGAEVDWGQGAPVFIPLANLEVLR